MTQLFAIVETRHSLLYKCTSFSIYYSVYLLLDKFIKTNYSSISWAVISCSTLWLIASPFSNRSFSVVITLPPPSTFQSLKCVHSMNGWIGEHKTHPTHAPMRHIRFSNEITENSVFFDGIFRRVNRRWAEIIAVSSASNKNVFHFAEIIPDRRKVVLASSRLQKVPIVQYIAVTLVFN